jgi:hypothetical protein
MNIIIVWLRKYLSKDGNIYLLNIQMQQIILKEVFIYQRNPRHMYLTIIFYNKYTNNIML